MPYQNNGGNFEKYPINTNSLTFFNDNMMMLVNFTDDKVHISFRDAVINEDGKKRYPRPTGEDKNAVMLTKERVVAFLRRIDNGFIPKFEGFIETRATNPAFDSAYSVAVPTNTDMTNMLALTTGKPENGFYVPALCYYKGINMETRIPSEMKIFKFSTKVPVFTDYDPSTGNYSSQFPEYPQLLIFRACLADFVKGQSKGRAHEMEMKFHDRFGAIRHMLEQLCIKQNIPVPQLNAGWSKNNTGSSTPPGLQNDAAVPAPAELKQWDPSDNKLLQQMMPGDGDLPY